VEELHAAIAAYLRAQRGPLGATDRRDAAILNIRHDGTAVPRCGICGAAISDDEGGLYNLMNMRDEHRCADHYIPF
jgi:hypothetical protein